METTSLALDTAGPSLLFLATLLPLHCYLLSGVEAVVVQVIGGFAVWSVGWGALEYILHKKDHSDHGSRHMSHHKDPSNPELRDVDLEQQKGRICGYFLCVWTLSGFWVAVGNIIGLVCYYINYERVHQMVHKRPNELDSWSNFVLDWHARHHDVWSVNFSVTTPLWDVIEGTADKKMKPVFDKRLSIIGWFALMFPLLAPGPINQTK